MKNCLTLLCLVLSLIANGQSKLIFWDAVNRTPIEDVYVYSASSSGQLLAISNEAGEIQILPVSFPVVISAYNYDSKQLSDYSDTVLLEPKSQELEEISIQGKQVPIEELYNRIITTSNVAALNDTNSSISGTYFEAVLIVDLLTNDSIRINSVCDLSIKKQHGKKGIDYQMYASNGEKTMLKRKEVLNLDTADIAQWFRILPTFSSLLQYDLCNEKKYRLNFKGTEVTRTPGCLTITESNRPLSKKSTAYYKNDTLCAYNYISHLACRGEKGVTVCFEENNRTVHFNRDEAGYFLDEGNVYAVFRLAVNAERMLIIVKKGFIAHPLTNQQVPVAIDKPEDYLKALPFAERTRLSNLFTFPIR